MTLYCKQSFLQKHPLTICTDLLLAQFCLEALEKETLSAESYIATSVKELNILVSKHNNDADSVNYVILLTWIICLCRCLEEWENKNQG